MRRRLRLFVLFGLAATTIDLAVLLALREYSLAGANIVALTVAATVAYVLNRKITFRADPGARWVRRPLWFAGAAVVAGTVDLVVLLALDRVGVAVVVAKLVAVAAAAVVRWVAYRRILFKEVRRELAERVHRPPGAGAPRLSVVIPAYSEEALIGDTIRAVADTCTRAVGDDFEIVVVDDGSPDATSARAAEAGARVVTLDPNRGKGGAVRAGVLASEGRAVVFTDADLAYAPPLLLDVMAEIENGWDVVVGSRRHADTNTLVKARRIRELGGRVINLLTHIVLLGNFHDTQCGIKGFRGDIGRVMFERCRVDGFAFDVEIFYLAEQDRLSLTEVPVEVTNRAGSSVRIVGDTVAVIADLFRVRHWAGAGHYRPTPEQRLVLDAVVDRVSGAGRGGASGGVESGADESGPGHR
ncbi:MAG: glycosyltransferase [Actinomycetota bacterium]